MFSLNLTWPQPATDVTDHYPRLRLHQYIWVETPEPQLIVTAGDLSEGIR